MRLDHLLVEGVKSAQQCLTDSSSLWAADAGRDQPSHPWGKYDLIRFRNDLS